MLSLYSPTLTSVHDCWKNHHFDYIHLCQHSDGSAWEGSKHRVKKFRGIHSVIGSSERDRLLWDPQGKIQPESYSRGKEGGAKSNAVFFPALTIHWVTSSLRALWVKGRKRRKWPTNQSHSNWKEISGVEMRFFLIYSSHKARVCSWIVSHERASSPCARTCHLSIHSSLSPAVSTDPFGIEMKPARALTTFPSLLPLCCL